MTTNTPALVPDSVGTSLIAQQSQSRLDVLRKFIAPGIPDVELEAFLLMAQRNELDPFSVPPQIWCVPRRARQGDNWITKYQPTMGIDGWRKLVERTGRVQDSQIEWCGSDGQWQDVWLDDKQPPVAARASVYVRGNARPQRFVCRFKEYAQYKDGHLTGMWQEKPAHMIGIRALSHCLKEVLRQVGGVAEGIELGEFVDFEPERVAQRRFWARADELGWDEPHIRAAFQVREQDSLAETIDRLGGWGKALSYIEGWSETRPTAISAPITESEAPASELLYTPAVSGDRLAPPGPPRSERPPTHEEPAEPYTAEDSSSDVGPDYLGVCAVCKKLPATAYNEDGELACSDCLMGSVVSDPDPDPEPDPEPPDEPEPVPAFIPYPGRATTTGSFVQLVSKHLPDQNGNGMLPTEIARRLGKDWAEGVTPADYERLWALLQGVDLETGEIPTGANRG